MSLGATKCFDRSAQEDPSSIKAATLDGSGVDAILDAVAAAAAQPAVITALHPQGPKVYTQPQTKQNFEIPEGVESTVISAKDVFSTNGGMNAMSGLVGLVEDGKYKLPVKVEVLGKGFQTIDQGLDKLKRGVSGIKYAVTL